MIHIYIYAANRLWDTDRISRLRRPPLKQRAITHFGEKHVRLGPGWGFGWSVTFASAATQEKSRNSPELLCNLAFGVWNLRLPQFDRISLRVMQAGKPAVGIRLRVNLDLDSRGFQLGRHFVEIPDPKVQHPDLLGIAEVVAGLLECAECSGSGLLLP